ncbi:MAG: DUF1015 family protein [Kofleriaceae bacterium]
MPQIAGFRAGLWNAKNELERDPSRAVYRYAQAFTAGSRTLVRKSFFCAVQLSPFSERVVRPHEATDPGARERAIAGIKKVGMHTDAVLAGFRDKADEVERLFRGVDNGRPAVELTTPDGTNHKLWRVSSAEIIGKLRPLFAPKPLHVLDGHARWEGMLAYRDSLGDMPMYSSGNYAFACLVNLDDPALAPGPRHRIVRVDVKKEDALATPYFIVEKLPGAAADIGKQFAALADTVAHQPAFVCVFAGDADAYKLTLKPEVSPVAEGVSVNRVIQKYDPLVCDRLFLAKVAPNAPLETTLDAAKIRGEGITLGVVMKPLSVDQIVKVDEVGEVLPFGSTAFFPQVARMLAYVVDPNEDLV